MSQTFGSRWRTTLPLREALPRRPFRLLGTLLFLCLFPFFHTSRGHPSLDNFALCILFALPVNLLLSNPNPFPIVNFSTRPCAFLPKPWPPSAARGSAVRSRFFLSPYWPRFAHMFNLLKAKHRRLHPHQYPRQRRLQPQLPSLRVLERLRLPMRLTFIRRCPLRSLASLEPFS